MSKYKKLLAIKQEQEQKENEELCEKEGHLLIKETRVWAPYPYSQEPYEIEYCSRCGFGIPVFA